MKNLIEDHEIKISPEAVASAHEDGIVILDGRRGRLFTANLAGRSIWQSIEEHLSFEGIAEKLCSEFQFARETTDEYTARFLAELEGYSLIEGRVVQ